MFWQYERNYIYFQNCFSILLLFHIHNPESEDVFQLFRNEVSNLRLLGLFHTSGNLNKMQNEPIYIDLIAP